MDKLASLPLAPLLAAALLWPLLLVARDLSLAFGAPGRSQRRLDLLWLSAAWPALAMVVLAGDGTLRLDAWLLGGVWELDGRRRLLLAFTALLWALASWAARGYLAQDQIRANGGDERRRRRLLRFSLLWPLTLCGNLLLLVAEDIASFYLGFALMTFAAYGLVIHDGTRAARTGGFAYLVMAALGEGLILDGLLWGAGSGPATTLSELRLALLESDLGVWMGLLLWLGFGVKAGVIGLHTWLPLAHPVAPTPASAVLSGVMIKAGLVGWMSTLPLGLTGVEASFGWLGTAMLWAGLSGAFAAALAGVLQRQPKAVLAYSSVSQMGVIAVLVSFGLLRPSLWSELSMAVVLFAVHHGLNKGALFLGVGVARQPPPWPAWLLWLLMLLPALSLAGVLGSGLLAKWNSKMSLKAAGEPDLVLWLSLAAVGTTALMTRTLWRQWLAGAEASKAERPVLSSLPLAWAIMVLAGLAVPLWIAARLGLGMAPPLTALPGLLWPAAAGLGLSIVLGWSLRRVAPRLAAWLPAGDLWWPLVWCARYLQSIGRWSARGLGTISLAWRNLWVRSEQALVIGVERLIRAEDWLRRQLASLLLIMASALAALLLSNLKLFAG
jgi:formate hydrogenlyase subunit 3/multisubunit Na+/H+ antiporter MnhD subunit